MLVHIFAYAVFLGTDTDFFFKQTLLQIYLATQRFLNRHEKLSSLGTMRINVIKNVSLLYPTMTVACNEYCCLSCILHQSYTIILWNNAAIRIDILYLTLCLSCHLEKMADSFLILCMLLHVIMLHSARFSFIYNIFFWLFLKSWFIYSKFKISHIINLL